MFIYEIMRYASQSSEKQENSEAAFQKRDLSRAEEEQTRWYEPQELHKSSHFFL
jgi:hypothetical protein